MREVVGDDVMSEVVRQPAEEAADDAGGRVLAVHFGRSANCSSIGSIVDFLFVSSVAGAALLSAVAVLLPRDADGDSLAEHDAADRDGSLEGAPDPDDVA